MGPDESALPTPDAAFPCCCAGITSRAGSCSSAPGSAPSLSHEGLGSSCHNKSAAGSLRDSQDSSPCQAAIAAPRERLLWAEIRNPLVTDSLSSVYKLSDTIKTLREKENGFFLLPEQQRNGLSQQKPELVVKEGNSCTLHSRIIPWDRSTAWLLQPQQHNWPGPSSSGFERRAKKLHKDLPTNAPAL